MIRKSTEDPQRPLLCPSQCWIKYGNLIPIFTMEKLLTFTQSPIQTNLFGLDLMGWFATPHGQSLHSSLTFLLLSFLIFLAFLFFFFFFYSSLFPTPLFYHCIKSIRSIIEKGKVVNMIVHCLERMSKVSLFTFESLFCFCVGEPKEVGNGTTQLFLVHLCFCVYLHPFCEDTFYEPTKR